MRQHGLVPHHAQSTLGNKQKPAQSVRYDISRATQLPLAQEQQQPAGNRSRHISADSLLIVELKILTSAVHISAKELHAVEVPNGHPQKQRFRQVITAPT